MKPSERIKIQKAISRIEAGDVDELIIDNLLIGLRPYSKTSQAFREIADFVAHPDMRDEGISRDSLEAFYLNIRYFGEFISGNKPLDLTKPFPNYLLKLMKYQIDKCHDNDLRLKFRAGRERLKARIATIFQEDRKKGLATVKKPKLLMSNMDAIRHLLGFIGSQPAFDQATLIHEIEAVVKANDFRMDTELYRKQEDRIMLAILLNLHGSVFEYGAHRPGYCKISCEKTAISHNIRYVDSAGNPVELVETHGCLNLMGHIVVQKDGKDLTVCYPLVSTQLTVEDHCDTSMIFVEPLSDDHPDLLFKKVGFDRDLFLTDDGKLGAVNA